MKEYSDYDLNKLACGKLLGIDFSKRPYEGRVDPLNDWGVLGPLMVKYKVNFIHHDEEIEGEGGYYEIWINGTHPKNTTLGHPSHFYESEIPRAIIMCILKSENII